VRGVLCKNGHFNDPQLNYCSVCGISMAQQTLVEVSGPRPPLGLLLFDDGSTFRLDSDYLVGRAPRQDPDVVAGIERLAGAQMVGGLSRRVAELTGSGAGAAFVLGALVEVARLARQVAKLPRERAERAASGDAWECWQLDTTGWIDLPNSCFAYSDAGRDLFGSRPVATPMQPDLYSPRPGQRRVFERSKHARLERADGRLKLFHSMHDNVHGFELTYEIDLATGRIVRAEHVTPRLPYMGICSEPQRRIAALLGETVDDGLRQRIQGHLGGTTGCAQLYDLTADLLKLLT